MVQACNLQDKWWLEEKCLEAQATDLKNHTREDKVALDQIKEMDLLGWDQVQHRRDQLVRTHKDLQIRKWQDIILDMVPLHIPLA